MPDPIITPPASSSSPIPWITLLVGAIGAFGAAYQVSGGQIGASITAAIGFIVGHFLPSVGSSK